MFVISHVSVICSSRQLTKVAKVLGRTAIYSVEHSRWLIFTFGVSVLIEMEPMRRYWVWKHMHILQKYVFSPLSMQILVYHVHKSLKETLFFLKISFSKPSNIHIFFVWFHFMCINLHWPTPKTPRDPPLWDGDQYRSTSGSSMSRPLGCIW